MLATLSGYPFHWQTGADQLLPTSIGTGFWREHTPVNDILEANVLDWARDIPMMLMEDASLQNQLLLQWLSSSPTAWTIDIISKPVFSTYADVSEFGKWLRRES